MVEKSAQPGPSIGRTFSQYEILEKIGEGGMGEVFLANDSSLERPDALKFLRARQNEDEASKRRFVEEAKSAARIDHAYVCKVYETGELDGHTFIAMEYVRGETLSERIAREPVPLAEALRIAVEISEALDAAHRRDVAHRDLKPSNIMLTRDGHVKVMDFGLAKRMPPSEAMASENEKETAHRAACLEQGKLAARDGHPNDTETLMARAQAYLYSGPARSGGAALQPSPSDRPTQRGGPLVSDSCLLHDGGPCEGHRDGARLRPQIWLR